MMTDKTRASVMATGWISELDTMKGSALLNEPAANSMSRLLGKTIRVTSNTVSSARTSLIRSNATSVMLRTKGILIKRPNT